jgi:hypothetical protein
MQTRDQHGKRSRDWKVIAAVATASALGISGLALAGPSDRSDDPDPINLRDRTSITEVTTVSSVPTTLAGLFDADSNLDSPFDDTSSPSVSSVSANSPDEPAPAVASPASADSPDSPPPPPPPVSADSPDSPDSVDSASSFDSSADS